MYINDNLAVDLHLETWRWSKLQTLEKACVLYFLNYQRLLVFFLPLLSLFEKKFLIWSMRKPRVINIILSSSVKFTVNQVLWMWAYALAPVLRVLYSQLHFRFEFEQLSLSITLKCLFFSDFAVIISIMNIAIFGAWNVLQSSNLFFCMHFLIVTPYLIVDKSLRIFFFFLHNY